MNAKFKIDVNACRVASQAIADAFVWCETVEGLAFWGDVTDRLEAYAERGLERADKQRCIAELKIRIADLEKSLTE